MPNDHWTFTWHMACGLRPTDIKLLSKSDTQHSWFLPVFKACSDDNLLLALPWTSMDQIVQALNHPVHGESTTMKRYLNLCLFNLWQTWGYMCMYTQRCATLRNHLLVANETNVPFYPQMLNCARLYEWRPKLQIN